MRRNPALSSTELLFLNGVAVGYSNRQIAERTCYTLLYVRSSLCVAGQKLGVHGRWAAMRRATELGMIMPLEIYEPRRPI